MTKYETAGFVSEFKKEAMTKKKHAIVNAVAGGLSGGIATAATLPIETVQIMESVKKDPKMKIIKDLFEEGRGTATGLKGIAKGVGRFYKGIDTKLLKVLPMMGLTFPIYQAIVHHMEKKYDK